MLMPRRTRRPLTPAQRRLAEQNAGLIVGAVDAYERLWPNHDRDEALSIAAEAFLRAVVYFDPSRGRLSTLAYSCTRRALGNAMRDTIRKAGCAAAYRRELRRRRAWTEPPTERPDTRWISLLDDRTRGIVELRAQGLTLMEIGDRVGLTSERVRKVLVEARPVVRAWLEAGGELRR